MADSTLYLYTSLTAGSSHIITATSRIETILKANKLPFRAIDVATDEAARKLWSRRCKGKKLPGLVKYGNIVGDLEEVEEWNEYGELRMIVNSFQDVDGMPATSNPLPVSETPATESTPKRPEMTVPRTSTIKIQNPPSTKQEDKKDDAAVLALRQASSEAANKAKGKTEEKKADVKNPEPVKSDEPSSAAQQTKAEQPSSPKAPRGSVAPELPDIAPDSPSGPKRPPLVPEVAAVSTANFHVDNAVALGLVEHHRGSIISGSDEADKDEVVTEIRQSISAAEGPSASLDALRKEAAGKDRDESIIEEVPSADETPLEEKEELIKPAAKPVNEQTKEVSHTETTARKEKAEVE
ncbi:hypothetical protein N7539_008392 [Penicillium diatomitis]|uniref:Glutaredoxin domain-containing protein n=1 Tax=Penicillium diatomitis TaxID=2819901 RepID=A0A9W9WTM7_9EURO|nr:uncharacterized protein N7539_008392 [Penicillium diatomitis]KAJ5475326.1 hypothetical protein N7539_008392 [Penicillium diatomitis]